MVQGDMQKAIDISLIYSFYIDFGLCTMLRKRGLRNIIAIDLRPAKNRPIATDRLRFTHIYNSMELGGPLDLSPAVLSRNYELGYLDTRKTFGFYDDIQF